ncbi:unannotated protein [freshwater metagenome]|uniref:Unannotated protein n=1 Tax=freshwater metagenome TaxID=449393 RepID=A0A6J7EWK9_9ZZZZ|nr:DUF861 domain-containing protein [Actinomycetota bacterium]
MYVPDILTAPANATVGSIGEWSFLDDGVARIGVRERAPGTYSDSGAGVDEMIFSAAGRYSVAHDGGAFDVVPGSSWVKPRNWASTTTVHQASREMYVIDTRAGESAPPAFLSNAYTLDLGTPNPRANPRAGEPKDSLHIMWEHNGLETGVWECTPGSFGISRDGYDEVMMILSGRATMHATNGHIFTLQAGSVLLTPEGFVGYWIIEETIRKVYTKVLRPA